MLDLLKNVKLKYKFWFLNLAVLAVMLLLVLYAMDVVANLTEQPFMTVFAETAPGFAGVVAVLMVLEMACSQLLITFITRHVNSLRKTMVRVHKNGDLSRRAHIDSKDEIGEMARAFNAMQERTSEVVGRMKEVMGRLQNEVVELAAATQQSRDELQRQQGDTDRSSHVVEEMLESFRGIADQADNAKELSHEARDAANDGSQRVARSSQSIQALAEAIQQSAASVEALAENGREISSAVTEIQGIAEQTNLLALNAAIEAARAGEQGRGFAVVADEVRNLAQRVQDSTSQIQDTIDRLLATMQDAVKQMTSSSEDANRCVEEADAGRVSLESINSLVQRIDQANQDIADVSGRQTAATDEVQDNIRGIRETTQSMLAQMVASAEMGERLNALIQELDSASSQVSVEGGQQN
ncbi:methyl-accepting chemotaxis protein [Marinobacteraceae bacterium S3BR75-40.1]